jgi:hypothetical protein
MRNDKMRTLEAVKDSEGHEIILGKGRQKTVYSGIFTDDDGNSHQVAYTDFPPFIRMLGHNKSYVVSYFLETDLDGMFTYNNNRRKFVLKIPTIQTRYFR